MISSGGQVISGSQIVVSSPNFQQFVAGKAQLATIGGHQVVIRSTPTGIVHLNSTNGGIIVKSTIPANKQG